VEDQRKTVDATAQAGWLWTVIEDMRYGAVPDIGENNMKG